MPKSLGSQIRYKTFLPASASESGGFAVDKAISKKLKTVFESKDGLDDKRIKRFIGTSESKDRDGEICLLDGWDFSNYEKNSVVLWAHDHAKLPIGKTVGVYKDETAKVIYFDIYFSEGYNFAKDVYTLVEEGILRATSVGFRVLDWEWNDKSEALVFTKMEMFEISVCNVPANQDAIAQEDSSKSAESDKAKAMSQEEVDQITSAVAQLRESLETLNSRVDLLITPKDSDPVVEEPPVVEPVTQQEEPPVTTEEKGDISEDAIARIVQAVVDRIAQSTTSVTEEVTEEVEEVAPVEDVPAETATEEVPPKEDEDDLVTTSIEDLDEMESFVIVNEEEN